MTDIGNRRQPPIGVLVSGADSTPVLMPAATTASSPGQSMPTFIQANINGISTNYSYPNVASSSATSGASSSPVSHVSISGTAPQQQQRKHQTAFIVLPISFRMASDGTEMPQAQSQQNVSSAAAPIRVSSVMTPSTVTTAPAEDVARPESADYNAQRQHIAPEQAVKNAVNWIVQDAKQRQQQHRTTVQQHIVQPQQSQQIYHRNNGKLPGQAVLSPVTVVSKCVTDNVRKFSTSSTMQREDRYFTYDTPTTISHSEPSTPHSRYSAQDGVAAVSRSIVGETGRQLTYSAAGDPVNGSLPSPANVVSGIPTTTEGCWPQANSRFGGATDLHPPDGFGEIGTFMADGVYQDADIALRTHNSFPGSVTGPTAALDSNENGIPGRYAATATGSSSLLISPTASSTISESASSVTPPVSSNSSRPMQPKTTAGNKSVKASGGGGGAFCAYEERQCKQRCINGYRHCIRHILCDPHSPYRPCNYVKKQGAKEIRCSNAVALSQGSEYCSTHLIMMGMKEAKRKKVTVPNTPTTPASGAALKPTVNGVHEKTDTLSPTSAPAKKKKASPKKASRQTSSQSEQGAPANTQVCPNLYNGPGNGNQQLQYDSANIQYHPHLEQHIYAPHSQQPYSQQPESSQQQPQAFLNNGSEGDSGRCTELPSTSTPVNNGVGFSGADFIQHHQQQQMQMTDEFHRAYYVDQQHYDVGYQDSQRYQQQMNYQPVPQAVYIPQPRQHDYVIPPPQQQPPYVCGQADQAQLQVAYDQQPHQEGHLYAHSYSTVVVQQQHQQEQSQQPYDQISMPPPPSMLNASGGANAVMANVANNNQGYASVRPEYRVNATPCTTSNHERNSSNDVSWKISPVSYNNPLPSPQKLITPVAGQGFVMYENGSNGNNSDLARSHPELAAHLLTVSSSSGVSPQVTHSLNSGGGTSSGGSLSFLPHASHQQEQRQPTCTSFQQQQQIGEPFDDSVQGFNAMTRGDPSYLLSGDDPFLSASSSSGYVRNGNVTNTHIGAGGMGVAILSPGSSDLSENSPHSVAVMTVSAAANAGVGLTSVSSGQQQQPKQTLPVYLHQPGANFLADCQSTSAVLRRPMLTQDGAASSSTEQRRPVLHMVSESLEAASAKTSRLEGTDSVTAGVTEKSSAPNVATQAAAPSTNKKVIRLKQKKRHLRMVGSYRQIPAVSHMCKILEDLDFDRKDLFPLGLEPSSSDTDSDDECDTDLLQRSLLLMPGERLGRRSTAENDGQALADLNEEINGSLLSPGIVSKARRQLYLLKKTLRLDENRIRRRVTMESRVMATASRLYPNSVGAALADRRRHRTRPLWRYRCRLWHPPPSTDSKKSCPPNAGGRKSTSKVKKYTTSVPEVDANAELELKRALTTRRCTFEAPATIVLVQHTGASGNVEHRRQVLAQQRCGNRCLPYCNFCFAHVLHSEDQRLYQKCAYGECHRAALDVDPETVPSCLIHLNRRMRRTTEGVKLNEALNLLQSQASASDERSTLLHKPQCQDQSQQSQKATSKSKKPQQRDPRFDQRSLPSTETDTAAVAKRKKKGKTPAQADDHSLAGAGNSAVVAKNPENKRAARASSSSLNKDDETAAVTQEALTLASVAQDFGFEDHELTEMLIRLPEEAFDGILEPDLARTGPGVITVTDSGGGNELGAVNQNLPPSSSALGVDAVEMAVQAATSSCSHNWADVEQFLLSEGYCGTGGNIVPGTIPANMGGFVSPPPAYTNLTNAATIPDVPLEQASTIQFPQAQLLHSQAASGPAASTTVWPGSAAPVETFVTQHQHSTVADGSTTILLPSIDVYTSAAAPVSSTIQNLVSDIPEQSTEPAVTTSSWSGK